MQGAWVAGVERWRIWDGDGGWRLGALRCEEGGSSEVKTQHVGQVVRGGRLVESQSRMPGPLDQRIMVESASARALVGLVACREIACT